VYEDDEWSLVAEPENRLGIVSIPSMMKSFLKIHYRSGVPSVFESDEELSVSHFGFVMHVALKDVIKLKASQIHEAGILSHITRNTSLEDFKSKPKEIGPQVLTLQHLSAGFVVICVLLGFSVFVFIAEFIPKLLKKLSEMLSVCYVVRVFVNRSKIPM
jgi:hypothetical protein